MDIEQMKVGFMDVFCYLVACPRSKEALVIDPAGNEDRVVERIREKNLDLRYIVNTHGHPDHICGNAKVKALTGAKILDLAPTMLYLLGEEVPGDVDGRVLSEIIEEGFKQRNPVRMESRTELSQSTETFEYSDQEEEYVREKLQGLGYVE